MRRLVGLLLIGCALSPSAAARADDPPSDTSGDEGGDEAPTKGTLVITARAPNGTAIDGAVEIDRKPMGDLEDGEMTLVNIPQGNHAVVILAEGYHRLEQAVAVRAGEEAKLDAHLAVIVPPSKTLWKGTLAASAVVIGVGVLYGYHGHDRMLANRDAVVVTEAPHPNDDRFDFDLVEPVDCGKSAAALALEKHAIVVNQDRFDRMCSWKTRSLIGYGVAGVGLVGLLVSVYMVVRHGEANEYTPTPRKNGLFRPGANPRSDGADFTLTFTW
jgi:hypothetical protein